MHYTPTLLLIPKVLKLHTKSYMPLRPTNVKATFIDRSLNNFIKLVNDQLIKGEIRLYSFRLKQEIMKHQSNMEKKKKNCTLH